MGCRGFMALLRRDCSGLLRDPGTLLYLSVPPLMGLLLNYLDGAYDSGIDLLLFTPVFCVGMTSTLPALYMGVFEFEHGVPITLARAGVPPKMMMWSKFAATVLWTTMMFALGLAMSWRGAVAWPPIAASMLPTIVTAAAIAVTFACRSRSLADTGIGNTVIVMLVFATVLVSFDDQARRFCLLLPVNLYAETVLMASGGPPVAPWWLTGGISAAWVVCSLGLMRHAMRDYESTVGALAAE